MSVYFQTSISPILMCTWIMGDLAKMQVLIQKVQRGPEILQF